MRAGLDRVEFDAQRLLFFTFAIIPWAALQPHDQDIIPDEVRTLPILQQTRVGGIGTKIAQGFGRMNARLGAALLERGAKITDRGNRVSNA